MTRWLIPAVMIVVVGGVARKGLSAENLAMMQNMMRQNPQIRGGIDLNTGFTVGDVSPAISRSTSQPSGSRNGRRQYNGRPRHTTVVSMGPAVPKTEPPKPEPTFEEIYSRLQKEYVPKVINITPEMSRQHHLKIIRSLAAEKSLNLIVIAECKNLIMSHPDSEEARKAKTILDETQNARRILLEEETAKRAWIQRVVLQSSRK